MAHVSTQSGLSASTASSLLHDLLINARTVAVAMANRYAAAQALSGFDARMLSDIGLRPEDIDNAFAEPVWRDPTTRLAALAAEHRAARNAVGPTEERAEKAAA